MLDPDRFLAFPTPGAQEWWYFDAISDDGRDALVLVWYAGLPFDPAYGVSALKHLKHPDRHPAPKALDHCAIGLSWYRDGKAIAYALNSFREEDFRHSSEPFSIRIGGNRLARDERGYALEVATPAVDGKTPLRAALRFRPASGTEPMDRDLGRADAPHVWILAAADCSVEGEVVAGGRSVAFLGRGYHDHNAGSEEISLAMRRWAWGRVHDGPLTHVYYRSEPRSGAASAVWITCRDGRPETVREGVEFTESAKPGGNIFGLRHGRTLRVSDSLEGLTDLRERCVDDGPFYRRWVGRITTLGDGSGSVGVSEWLDTRNLNRPLFNWMIPFRLKRPKISEEIVS